MLFRDKVMCCVPQQQRARERARRKARKTKKKKTALEMLHRTYCSKLNVFRVRGLLEGAGFVPDMDSTDASCSGSVTFQYANFFRL